MLMIEFNTFYIFLIVLAIHAGLIWAAAEVIRIVFRSRQQMLTKAANLHKIISWIFTIFVSICGFYLTATILESINFTVAVGGHNAVGTIFFMFFVVVLFGKFLIRKSSLRIIKN